MFGDNVETTGGPAFPAFEIRTHDTQDLVANASQGMTLRDWFAGQALIGIIANQALLDVISKVSIVERVCPSVLQSRAAYETADAMLAHRSQECPKQP